MTYLIAAEVGLPGGPKLQGSRARFAKRNAGRKTKKQKHALAKTLPTKTHIIRMTMMTIIRRRSSMTCACGRGHFGLAPRACRWRWGRQHGHQRPRNARS